MINDMVQKFEYYVRYAQSGVLLIVHKLDGCARL